MESALCFNCGHKTMKRVMKPHEVDLQKGVTITLDLFCYECLRCKAEGYSQDMEDDNKDLIDDFKNNKTKTSSST